MVYLKCIMGSMATLSGYIMGRPWQSSQVISWAGMATLSGYIIGRPWQPSQVISWVDHGNPLRLYHGQAWQPSQVISWVDHCNPLRLYHGQTMSTFSGYIMGRHGNSLFELYHGQTFSGDIESLRYIMSDQSLDTVIHGEQFACFSPPPPKYPVWRLSFKLTPAPTTSAVWLV